MCLFFEQKMKVMLKLRMEGSFRTKIIAELIFTFDCLQYISRELNFTILLKNRKPPKFPPAKICGIKVYSQSECWVKDYFD